MLAFFLALQVSVVLAQTSQRPGSATIASDIPNESPSGQISITLVASIAGGTIILFALAGLIFAIVVIRKARQKQMAEGGELSLFPSIDMNGDSSSKEWKQVIKKHQAKSELSRKSNSFYQPECAGSEEYLAAPGIASKTESRQVNLNPPKNRSLPKESDNSSHLATINSTKLEAMMPPAPVARPEAVSSHQNLDKASSDMNSGNNSVENTSRRAGGAVAQTMQLDHSNSSSNNHTAPQLPQTAISVILNSALPNVLEDQPAVAQNYDNYNANEYEQQYEQSAQQGNEEHRSQDESSKEPPRNGQAANYDVPVTLAHYQPSDTQSPKDGMQMAPETAAAPAPDQVSSSQNQPPKPQQTVPLKGKATAESSYQEVEVAVEGTIEEFGRVRPNYLNEVDVPPSIFREKTTVAEALPVQNDPSQQYQYGNYVKSSNDLQKAGMQTSASRNTVPIANSEGADSQGAYDGSQQNSMYHYHYGNQQPGQDASQNIITDYSTHGSQPYVEHSNSEADPYTYSNASATGSTYGLQQNYYAQTSQPIPIADYSAGYEGSYDNYYSNSPGQQYQQNYYQPQQGFPQQSSAYLPPAQPPMPKSVPLNPAPRVVPARPFNVASYNPRPFSVAPVRPFPQGAVRPAGLPSLPTGHYVAPGFNPNQQAARRPPFQEQHGSVPVRNHMSQDYLNAQYGDYEQKQPQYSSSPRTVSLQPRTNSNENPQYSSSTRTLPIQHNAQVYEHHQNSPPPRSMASQARSQNNGATLIDEAQYGYNRPSARQSYQPNASQHVQRKPPANDGSTLIEEAEITAPAERTGVYVPQRSRLNLNNAATLIDEVAVYQPRMNENSARRRPTEQDALARAMQGGFLD